MSKVPSIVSVLDDELMQFLEFNGCRENESGNARRSECKESVRSLFTKWLLQSYPMYKPTVQLAVSGSYRLGVHKAHSDIDMVIFLPNYVQLAHYFGVSPSDTATLDKLEKFSPIRSETPAANSQTFVDFLRQNEHITKVESVPGASVPLIKCFYDQYDLDLIPVIIRPGDEINLVDPNFLERVAHPCRNNDFQIGAVRSAAGPRHSAFVLKTVEDAAKNAGVPVDTALNCFREMTRFLKFWAENRDLYQNVNCLGGIATAVLAADGTARFVRDSASPTTVIAKTFAQLAQRHVPEYLHDIQDAGKPAHEELVRKIQKDIDASAARKGRVSGCRRVMNTPCFPYENILRGMVGLTADVLKSEFVRAARACQVMLRGEQGWEYVTEHFKFPYAYTLYIEFTMVAPPGAEPAQMKHKNMLQNLIGQMLTDLVDRCSVEGPANHGMMIDEARLSMHTLPGLGNVLESRWAGLKVIKANNGVEPDVRGFMELIKRICDMKSEKGSVQKDKPLCRLRPVTSAIARKTSSLVNVYPDVPVTPVDRTHVNLQPGQLLVSFIDELLAMPEQPAEQATN